MSEFSLVLDHHINEDEIKCKNLLFLTNLTKKKFSKQFLEKKNVEVSSNIWNDEKKFESDYFLLIDLYEDILDQLYSQLNSYHKKNYSKRFWRIVIGPWLNYFTSLIYERWGTIENVFKNYKIKKVYVNNYKEKHIPFNMDKFIVFIFSDTWNQSIYREIVLNFNKQNIEICPLDKKDDLKKNLEHSNKTSIKNLLIKLILKKKIFNFNSKKKILFFSTNLDNEKKNLITKKLSKTIFLPPIPPFISDFKINYENRKKLSLRTKNNDEFNQFLVKKIKENIPIIFLELFNKHLDYLKTYDYPENPDHLITASGLNHNSNMSRYVAEKLENNSKLIFMQHGGCYGQYLYHWPEYHETEVSDKYLSWGWTDKKKKKIIPIGLNKNLKLKTYKKENLKDIYLEIRVRSKYTSRLSSDKAFNHQEYIKNCQELISKVKNSKIYKNFFIRMHHRQLGWREEDEFKKIDPNIKFCSTELSSIDLRNNSKVYIHTSLSTGHLESASLRIPFLIYQDKRDEPFREEHKHYIEEMENFKILFSDPQELVSHLEYIDNNLDEWWNNKNLQLFLKNYSEKFSKLNENYANDLAEVLLDDE